jgi:hypothetical protein
MFLTCLNARAQENFATYEREFATAKQLILDGHVKDGVSQMVALLGKIDPTKDPNNYWLLSINLADCLHQSESYQEESTVLNQLLAKTPPNTSAYVAQTTLLRVGRNLAFTGHADDGERTLRNSRVTSFCRLGCP